MVTVGSIEPSECNLGQYLMSRLAGQERSCYSGTWNQEVSACPPGTACRAARGRYGYQWTMARGKLWRQNGTFWQILMLDRASFVSVVGSDCQPPGKHLWRRTGHGALDAQCMATGRAVRDQSKFLGRIAKISVANATILVAVWRVVSSSMIMIR